MCFDRKKKENTYHNRKETTGKRRAFGTRQSSCHKSSKVATKERKKTFVFLLFLPVEFIVLLFLVCTGRLAQHKCLFGWTAHYWRRLIVTDVQDQQSDNLTTRIVSLLLYTTGLPSFPFFFFSFYVCKKNILKTATIRVYNKIWLVAKTYKQTAPVFPSPDVPFNFWRIFSS